jgi:uncharacterized protein (TIGR02145 family)
MKKIIFLTLLVHFCSTAIVLSQLFGGRIQGIPSPYPAGTVHCNPQNRTAVVEVVSITGRIWMDRNLGAERVATTATDALAFGDLYQWGRGADGHQCRNSLEQTGRSATDQPGHNKFVTVTRAGSTTNDWRNPQNDALWQGVNGTNNPCPKGFRLPTETEARDERRTWSSQSDVGAFNSVLKLPLAGYRDINGDVLAIAQGSAYGFIWTSSDSGTSPTSADPYIQYKSEALAFNGPGDKAASAFENPYDRARGYSIRCIKD